MHRKNYLDLSVEYGNSYTYTVTAKDTYGNTSIHSNQIKVDFNTDKTNPEISYVSKTSGYIAPKFEFTAEVNDNQKIKSLAVYTSSDKANWTEKAVIASVLEGTSESFKPVINLSEYK